MEHIHVCKVVNPPHKMLGGQSVSHTFMSCINDMAENPGNLTQSSALLILTVQKQQQTKINTEESLELH